MYWTPLEPHKLSFSEQLLKVGQTHFPEESNLPPYLQIGVPMLYPIEMDYWPSMKFCTVKWILRQSIFSTSLFIMSRLADIPVVP